MIATMRPLTYDDLLEIPDDGRRYEIIGGELIVNPAPAANHQRVLGTLYRLLDDYARRTNSGEVFLAPFDVILSRHDIVEPDILFLRASRGRVPGADNSVEGAPDLVVEIISPSSRGFDRVRKMALYARAGVPEYWIADPERRTLTINVLSGADYAAVDPDATGRLPSRVLATLCVDPVEVFADVN